MRQDYKDLRLIVRTIIQLIVMICVQITPVFADETGINTGSGGDVNIGGGEGSGEGTQHMNTGYHQSDGGYRCYMEDKNGSIVQPIVDFYFDYDYYNGVSTSLPKSGQTYWGKQAALGGTAGTRKLRYSSLEDLIPGLRQPLYGHQAWGPNLNAWFESDDNASTVPGASNAELFIVAVFNSSEYNAQNLLYNYKLGNYRIVVEGIYWYNLLAKNGDLIQIDGKTQYVYGTVRDIATYNQTATIAGIPVNELISNYPERRTGGGQLNAYTNRDFATAIMLVEDDEFSKFVVPNLPASSDGKYTYETLLADKQGWDMHVIYKERASEKWATWDSTKYGGYQEASPGVAPKQPEIPGVDNTKIHPVTIIKYYELEKVERDSSGKKKTVYETVTGPTRQTKICTTIAEYFVRITISVQGIVIFYLSHVRFSV